MKKILSWCGSHTELLCAFFLLGCCISSAVKDGWSVAILFLPFIAMWIFTYHLQKEISRLIKKNEELKENNKRQSLFLVSLFKLFIIFFQLFILLNKTGNLFL